MRPLCRLLQVSLYVATCSLALEKCFLQAGLSSLGLASAFAGRADTCAVGIPATKQQRLNRMIESSQIRLFKEARLGSISKEIDARERQYQSSVDARRSRHHANNNCPRNKRRYMWLRQSDRQLTRRRKGKREKDKHVTRLPTTPTEYQPR